MLESQHCALVIVDMQGNLAKKVHQATALEKTLITLISAAVLFEIPIVWLEQLPEKLGTTSPAIKALLQDKYHPIIKTHFNACQTEKFQQTMTNLARSQVLIAGIESHICVYQTCRGLLDNQYQVHVVADGVSSRTQTNKQLGIEMMTQHGAVLTNCESLLFELQQHASGDRFKALLKMIK